MLMEKELTSTKSDDTWTKLGKIQQSPVARKNSLLIFLFLVKHISDTFLIQKWQ